MIKVYLASYFQPKNWGKGRKIQISRTRPPNIKWDIGDLSMECFMPSAKLLKDWVSGKLTKEDYIDRFLEYHYKYWPDHGDSEGFWYDIKYNTRIEDGDTMLCWELTGEFCHRQIVAELLKKHGYEVILDGVKL